MDPLVGQIIVGAVVAVLAFVCGRNVLRDIRSELHGDRSCAGCSGCQTGKSCEECRMCARLEELKRQKSSSN